MQTRPIYHKCDETIRGHVFCSFLALVLRQELQARLEERGHELEWADVIEDLDRLQMVEVEQDGKRFLLRSEVQGTCGKVFQAVGVALPPTVQQVLPPPSSRSRILVPRRACKSANDYTTMGYDCILSKTSLALFRQKIIGTTRTRRHEVETFTQWWVLGMKPCASRLQ